MESVDRNCMSFWFPKIEAVGMPVPRTKFLTMPKPAQMDVWKMIDNEKPEPDGSWSQFVTEAQAASDEIGYPLFLRTGHTSGKHDWEKTCHVLERDKLGQHIFSIIYFSECHGVFGELPWEIWALREFLPTKPIGICARYSNMPICREFRFFVDDGAVRCWHPYWPLFSLEEGRAQYNDDAPSYEDFCKPDDLAALTKIACAAGRAVGGSWSVDLLETERGWFLTDMAEANRSFHWPECTTQMETTT